MNSKKLRLSLILTLVGLSSYVFAQDAATTEEEEKPTFTLSGSVDAYFHTSFGAETKAPATSFAQLPGFSLGMVNLVGSYQGKRAGFVADLVFGPRGADAVFVNQYTGFLGGEGDTGQRIVNQLLAYYKVSDAVTLNLGQFNTFLGYEVISPAVNFHYSTSYMFSYGPFNHTGLRADIDLGGGNALKFAVMNPTDFVEFNDANSYTLGAQYGHTSDAGGVWLNFLYGDQDGKLEDYDRLDDGYSEGATLQADITGGWNLSETFYLGVNATYRTLSEGEAFDPDTDEIVDSGEDTKGFMGFAVYPKITLSETFALGLRAEYFAVTGGYITPFALDEGDGNVIALTLSGNYKVEGLTIIPEIRMDKTSEDTFVTKDFEDVTDNLVTFNLAAVYKF